MEKQEPIKIEYGMSATLGIPEDAYECKIIDIVENTKVNKLSKRNEKGGLFSFEIIDGPHKGKQFINFFTNKITKRSKLSILCRGIWGREFEPEEMAQIEYVKDLKRFLLNKPVKVIVLIRHSFLTDSIWYDIAFFLQSKFFDETLNRVIIPKK